MVEFNTYAQSYSADIEDTIGIFGKSHDFFVRTKVAILRDAMSTVLDPRGAKLIDVGCGVGLIHKYLGPEVDAIVGVDVSEKSLEKAAKDNPTVTYQHYDGDRLPVADGSFDCAFAICVMHHVPVPHWQSFMNEMARVVRPGGMAIVIEHNPMNPATRWVVKRCPLDKGATLLAPGTLVRTFQSAGLQQVTTRYFQFTPFKPRPFRVLDSALSWLPIGAQYCVSGLRRN